MLFNRKVVIGCLAMLVAMVAFADVTVKVEPINKKQSSGVYVNAGDTIKVEAAGQWTLWDQYKPVDANGHKDFIVNDLGAWGALVGRIGNHEFLLGTSAEFTSEIAGVLYLYPNKGKYVIENQSGELDVTISGGISVDEFKANLAANGSRMSFDPKGGVLNTEIRLAAGEEAEIYAFGEWTMWDGIYPEVSAEGHDFAAKDASWGKLCGIIGTSYGVGTQTFQVGERTKVTANADGFLSLYPYISNYVAVKNGVLDIIVVGGTKITSDDAELKASTDESVKDLFGQQVLAELNELRQALGLADLTVDTRLTQTAFGHAKYMVLNDSFSKNEDESKEGFIGKTFTDRLKNVSFEGKAREMFCQSEMTPDVVNILFDSVYHRLRLMSPLMTSVGYGSYRAGDKTIHVFDFGYMNNEQEAEFNATEDKPEAITYPTAGMENVSYEWNGVVNPNPFPEDAVRPFGTPVSILFIPELTAEVSSTLTDASGDAIDCFVISPDKDINNKNLNGVTIVPKKPLAANTKYTAEFVVRLGTSEEDQTFSVEFTTKE